MNSEQLNLTYQLDDIYGSGQWENKLKNILFESIYQKSLDHDITDNSDNEFIHTVYHVIENLIQDRKTNDRLGNLEVITPSVLEVNLLLGKYNDSPLCND